MSTCHEPSLSLAPPADGFVNIAAYLFAPLDRLPDRRQELRTLCRANELKGTILLSPEGINLFLAGRREGIDRLVGHLRRDPLLAELQTKESLSDRQPFRRLLVKLKQEIIAFGMAGIDPRSTPSAKLPARELKRWLDEGRSVTLLDTRNDYEVALGTFERAIPIGVDHFRDFPAAVGRLPAELKERPVVIFCTGGIRCEKAGPFMEQQGFREVYQLDGGILKYFEECGGDHFRGECFVFDQRVALDPHLHETQTTQCFACQHPLTAADQQSPHYVIGVSCPHCHQPLVTRPPFTLAQREAAIAVIADPLPGAGPYESQRPLNVPARYDLWPLVDFLCDAFPHTAREEWLTLIGQQRIRDRSGPLAADRVVRGGQRIVRFDPDTSEPPVNAAIRVLAWEDDYVVLHKPAPLPMHPCGRFNRNSMTELLRLAFPQEQLSPAHRLDANTTGIVVFSRSRQAARAIQRQFEVGTVAKTYLCRVVGHPAWDATTSTQPISRVPATNGVRVIDTATGDDAETVFHVLARLETGDAIIEATPRTGRTNQIRAHLWDLGHPVVGDPAYLPAEELGDRQTLTPADPPMCLHAWRLTFARPVDGAPVLYESEPPPWAKVGTSSRK